MDVNTQEETYIQIAYLRERLTVLPFTYRSVFDHILETAPKETLIFANPQSE